MVHNNRFDSIPPVLFNMRSLLRFSLDHNPMEYENSETRFPQDFFKIYLFILLLLFFIIALFLLILRLLFITFFSPGQN